MSSTKPYRIILSGGGTGGHIYPAIAVADEFKRRFPEAEILFVGAEGKMEMKKVPSAGYKIEGLWISGLQRRLTWKNLLFPIKLLVSSFSAAKIVRSFKPDVVAGFGGYASAPITRAAERRKIPTVLQEQNSYAGLANKMLAKRASKICVAYEKMERYFPSEKIVHTGNPVRPDIRSYKDFVEEAKEKYGLSGSEKVLLIIGGSLGSRTLNESMLQSIDSVAESGAIVIWQTGSFYYKEVLKRLEGKSYDNIHILEFIDQMNLTYAVADVIISRAGATSISELQVVGKPVVFVPSPNVAEDHQTKNAMSLVEKDAALMVKDSEAMEQLVDTAMELLNNEDRKEVLSRNISMMAKPNATVDIVNEIEELIK